MKILSLDQATNKTGVAVFEDKELKKYYIIDLSKSKSSAEQRINEMMIEINKTIEKENPDVIVFEDVAYQSNAQTLIKLARLQGSIIYYCISNNYNYTIITPSDWRSSLSFMQGKGCKRKFLKNQSILYVKVKYKKDVTDDEADAICIGTAYIQKNKI